MRVVMRIGRVVMPRGEGALPDARALAEAVEAALAGAGLSGPPAGGVRPGMAASPMTGTPGEAIGAGVRSALWPGLSRGRGT